MTMIPRKQNAPASTEGATDAKVIEKTVLKKVVTPAAQTIENTAEQPAAETAAPAAATAVAVAAPAAGAVSTRVAKKQRNAIEENFKGKVQLEWNTLPRIQANQGHFLDLENNKQPIGDEIVVQLMSYQESWQLSPGTDDPNDTQYVRYSDDGVYANGKHAGELLNEHLAELKAAGYDKAKINSRYMMALAIEGAGPKGQHLIGQIVQIDMSESSKKAFDSFMLSNGFKESRGLISSEVAESGRLKMSTTIKSGNGRTWTVIQFDNAA